MIMVRIKAMWRRRYATLRRNLNEKPEKRGDRVGQSDNVCGEISNLFIPVFIVLSVNAM